MKCDHKVESFYFIGDEKKRIGTLTNEDLDFLIEKSHPGFDCSVEDCAAWICKNEDIRIINEMSKFNLNS